MGKGRAPCCDSSQVKRGSWSAEESEKLRSFIEKNGHSNWRSLPKLAGLMRCGKSCRLRWINYLRPGLKRGNFTKEEEDSIIQLHQAYGNKWSKIASHFPGRTDNEIKNMWNTHLKKRSSHVNNHSVSSSSSSSSSSSASSSISSGFTNVIKCESIPKEEQFEEILGEHMACGFEVNAPQSLECIFQDHHIPPPPPPPISKPESLETHEESDLELWSQPDEPGLDDANEWLNYLDNKTC